MIAAEEETIRILRIIVTRVKSYIQKRLVDGVDEFS